MGQLEKLLTVGELAERLGVTQGTLYHWISNRRIPHTKVGRRVLFDPRAIEEWLVGRRRPAMTLRQRRERTLRKRESEKAVSIGAAEGGTGA